MGRSRKRKYNSVKASHLDAVWTKCFSKLHKLPSSDTSAPLSDEEMGHFLNNLESMKEELNSTKSLLNNIDIVQWHRHTKMTHICSGIQTILAQYIKAELVTQAWAKFYTILSTFDLFANIDISTVEVNTLHLCEAPGSFVTSLNHFFKSHYSGGCVQWKWCATTLNPYYEGNDTGHMIEDDRFVIETLKNWDFGVDFTGDIMNIDNLNHMKKKYKDVSVALVTADGSTDCSADPGAQENSVALLLLWETLTALTVLSTSGCFVLKIFTLFEKFSISLVYFLTRFFHSVSFIKPGPSKPGNSEVYVVCENYCREECLQSTLFEKFLDAAMKNNISHAVIANDVFQKTFLQSVLDYVRISSSTQVNTINDNLQSFKDKLYSKEELKETKDYIAKRFLKEFSVYPIDDFISTLFVWKTRDGLFYNRSSSISFKQGSYNDRLNSYESEEKETKGAPSDNSIEKLSTIKCTVDESCYTSLPNFKFIIGKKVTVMSASCFIPSARLNVYLNIKHKYCETVNKVKSRNCSCVGYSNEIDEINQRFQSIELLNMKTNNMLFISCLTDTCSTDTCATQCLTNHLEHRNISTTHRVLPERKQQQSNNRNDDRFDIVIADIGDTAQVSKQSYFDLMREILFNLQQSQNLLLRVEGLILSAFHHGFIYLISGLFTEMILISSRCSNDTHYVVLLDCTVRMEVVRSLNDYLVRLDDALSGLEEGEDILHVVDVYTLMQSDYCKFMTSRNETLSKEFQ